MCIKYTLVRRHVVRWWRRWLHHVTHDWPVKVTTSSDSSACSLGTHQQCQGSQEDQVSTYHLTYLVQQFPFSAPTRLVGRQEGHLGVQFSSPGLTWCWVQALQDLETVINVIHAVVAETDKFSDVAGMQTGMAWMWHLAITYSMP